MQRITVAGHVGKDPESRFTTNSQKLTTFSIAANSRRAGKEDITTWYRITVWGDRFDKMLTFVKKGYPLIVTGDLNKPEIYTDKEGRQQISLEISVGNSGCIDFSPFGKTDKPAGEQQQGASANNYSAAQNNYGAQNSNGGGVGSYDHQASNTSYNRAPYNGDGQVTSGQSMQSNSTNEDALPF